MRNAHEVGFSKAETSAINLIESRVLPALKDENREWKDYNPWLDILSHAYADGYAQRDLEVSKILKELQ